jgi:hypothetical protein
MNHEKERQDEPTQYRSEKNTLAQRRRTLDEPALDVLIFESRQFSTAC